MVETPPTPQAPAARPVNFAGWEVLAALEGRATQFRRVVKDVPAWCDRGGFSAFCRDGEAEFRGRHPDRGPASVLRRHKFGRSGERLWVREAFARVPATAYRCSVGVQQTINPAEPHYSAVYAAGWERCKPSVWRSSATMPRWASRLLLEITAIRVERVQEISEADAQACGCNVRVLRELLARRLKGWQPPPPWWDEHCQPYCRPCGAKACGEEIEGGFAGEEDHAPYCESCGKLLDYTLTNYGMLDEFDCMVTNGVGEGRENAYWAMRTIGGDGHPILTESCRDFHHHPELKGPMAKLAYRTVWDSIHPAGLRYDDNPWTFVVEYKRIQEVAGAAA